MPVGAFRLNSLARYVASTSRTAKTVTAYGNAQVSTAQSKFGGASAVFDGNGDYLSTSNSISTTGNYTIEAWFRVSSFVNNSHIFYTGVETSGRFVLYLSSSGVLLYDTYGGDGPDWTSIATGLTTNTWYHVAIVRNSGTIKIYLNGVEKVSGTSTVNMPTTGLQIGTGNFNGYIDEVRVSHSARYTAAFTAPTAAFTNDADTVLLLHCNGTNASTSFPDDNS